MINYEKVTEIMQKPEFQREAASCATMEDFQKLFDKHEANLTPDDVVSLISDIAKKQEEINSGEMSADDLDAVAGGLVISTALFCVGVGVVCLGAGALSAYVSYNKTKWDNKGK